jgi:hypothetical protein
MANQKSQEFHPRIVTLLILVGGTFVLSGALSAQPQNLKSESHHAAGAPSTQTSKTPTSQDADHDASVAPRHDPSAAEILRELSRTSDAPRAIVLPSQPGQQRQVVVASSSLPPNAVAPLTQKLYPDGYRIVDRPGRLTREADYYTFSFESRSEGPVEIPVRLLPNRLLEDMEIVSSGGVKPVVFIISGEMTSYHGVNYLLVQKLLTRTDLGNLK